MQRSKNSERDLMPTTGIFLGREGWDLYSLCRLTSADVAAPTVNDNLSGAFGGGL